jgi:integrase
VLALYARGLSTREIQAHLEELYGVEVSPTLVSNVTDTVLDEVRAWQSRPLASVYPILYFDALFVKSRQEGPVHTKAVYVALGITVEGEKELLGLWLSEIEGAKFWLTVFTELKNRGVEDCFIACVDGLKGLPEAIAPATLNYEMCYLQRSFKLAKQKKLIDRTPPHAPRFRVTNARQGFFERDDCERVVSFLPDYAQDFARFGYLTGWRFGEIATLEWRDIQGGTIRLRPEVSKDAEGRVLTIVGELAELIEKRRTLRVDLLSYVFHRRGQKIDRFYEAWRNACTKAGVPGKLFHDLRRTAVRNMIRAGVPERIAMAISGHKTRRIFDRYNFVNEEDIRQGLLKTQAYIAQDEQKRVIPLFSGNLGQETHRRPS